MQKLWKYKLISKNKIHFYIEGQSLFKKQELLPKRLISYLLKELRTPKRPDDVEDESIWSFIARRFEPAVADNLVDPLFKGNFKKFLKI